MELSEREYQDSVDEIKRLGVVKKGAKKQYHDGIDRMIKVHKDKLKTAHKARYERTNRG